MPKAKAKKSAKKPAKKAKRAVGPAKKKVAEKCCCGGKEGKGKLIGRITHYFSNIEVAVLDLTAPLKLGDKMRIAGGEATDFEQKVSSMQIDHEQVKSAKKGDSVGMKVDEKVHEGYKVYKI